MSRISDDKRWILDGCSGQRLPPWANPSYHCLTSLRNLLLLQDCSMMSCLALLSCTYQLSLYLHHEVSLVLQRNCNGFLQWSLTHRHSCHAQKPSNVACRYLGISCVYFDSTHFQTRRDSKIPTVFRKGSYAGNIVQQTASSEWKLKQRLTALWIEKAWNNSYGCQWGREQGKTRWKHCPEKTYQFYRQSEREF